ncbi:MAG: glycosyltransferase [Acidobacteriota bacterium]|nr:glycosyltransferase [Acidobacteriota bacterium]
MTPPRQRWRAAAWRAHDHLRNWAWSHAHGLRRWRAGSWRGAVPARVFHVTTSFDLGGTQTQIKHLCTATTGRYEHHAAEMFPELNYLFRQGVAVAPARYVTGGPLKRLIGRLIVNRNRRGFHLVQIAKLVRDFRIERPGVVVGWGHEMCVTTFVAAAIARVPRIVFCIRTVNPAFGWVEPTFAALLLKAFRRMTPLVNKTVVNSTFLRDDHGRWVGMDLGEIAVCANGIATQTLPAERRQEARTRVRAQYGIAADAVVITNVGRFYPEKGQLSLVKANGLLLQRPLAKPVVWILCGDGPTLPGVQAAATDQGMSNMIFTGRTAAVQDILAASDIFVMPSDFEGMPNALMEAMAATLPCVSTTRSGARDVARDGIDALYYEPGDAGALARHLEGLIVDPATARALAASAAARVAEFSVPRFVGTFEAILDEVTSTPGRDT